MGCPQADIYAYALAIILASCDGYDLPIIPIGDGCEPIQDSPDEFV
jgi:hypothetical protein